MKTRTLGAALAAAALLCAPVLATPAAHAEESAPVAAVTAAEPGGMVLYDIPDWLCRVIPRMCP